MCRIPNRSRARRLAASPSASALPGSSSTPWIAAESARAAGGTSTAAPSAAARVPPTSVATTARPHAIASSSATESPSWREGSTNASAARSQGNTSAVGPAKRTAPSTP